jgi:hypothetical protein
LVHETSRSTSPATWRAPPKMRSRYFTIWSYRRVLFDPYLPLTGSSARAKPARSVKCSPRCDSWGGELVIGAGPAACGCRGWRRLSDDELRLKLLDRELGSSYALRVEPSGLWSADGDAEALPLSSERSRLRGIRPAHEHVTGAVPSLHCDHDVGARAVAVFPDTVVRASLPHAASTALWNRSAAGGPTGTGTSRSDVDI